MKRARKPSPQTAAVLTALTGSGWRHGYELSRETGLTSGTLYPLLARLHDGGLLEAEWRPSPEPGRPPRHAYRLTAAGVEFARSIASAESASPVRLAGAPA